MGFLWPDKVQSVEKAVTFEREQLDVGLQVLQDYNFGDAIALSDMDFSDKKYVKVNIKCTNREYALLLDAISYRSQIKLADLRNSKEGG